MSAFSCVLIKSLHCAKFFSDIIVILAKYCQSSIMCGSYGKPATWLILVIFKNKQFRFPKCNKDAIRDA